MAPIPVLHLQLPADVVGFRTALLAWFDRDGRSLAFRSARDPDPWAVLVSEVMAQQTQVGRVAERWRAFMDRFPTPAALAAAPTGDVIRAWQGLGYNRRAIDLQRASRAIVLSGGRVPRDVDALRALPGVGPYTARAVAAIAFGRPVGAVDVNVRRVLGRLIRTRPTPGAAADPAPASIPLREIQAAADALVDPTRAGAWTHALMDLGATLCRPARPDCGPCPVRRWCAFPGSAEDRAARAAVDDRAAAPAVAAPSTHAVAEDRAVHEAAARPARAAAAAPKSQVAAAQSPQPARRASRPGVPFEATTRWLRGRIVDRLCSVPPGTSVTFHGPLGVHAPAAVTAALASLAADGLVELDGGGAARLAGERA